MSPAAWIVDLSHAFPSPIKSSILIISTFSAACVCWVSWRWFARPPIWRSVVIIWLIIQCSFSVLFSLPSLLFKLFLVKAPLLAQLSPIFDTIRTIAHILLNGQIGEVDWADGLRGHISAGPMHMRTKDYLRFVLFSLVFAKVVVIFVTTPTAWGSRSRTRSATAVLWSTLLQLFKLAPNFEVTSVQFSF